MTRQCKHGLQLSGYPTQLLLDIHGSWEPDLESNSVQLFHLILCRGLAGEPSLSGAKNPCRERSSYFIVFKTTAINDRQNSWSSSRCRGCLVVEGTVLPCVGPTSSQQGRARPPFRLLPFSPPPHSLPRPPLLLWKDFFLKPASRSCHSRSHMLYVCDMT